MECEENKPNEELLKYIDNTLIPVHLENFCLFNVIMKREFSQQLRTPLKSAILSFV
jgi:hypothetical protein